MHDRREFFENLVYFTFQRRRFLQQSPVMPDVWIKYGLEPSKQIDLLMVPNWHFTTADLARELKERLKADHTNKKLAAFRAARGKGRPQAIAHNQNVVVATLWFDELIRAVLPLSDWWKRSIAQITNNSDKDQLHKRLKQQKTMEKDLVTAWGGTKPKQISSDVVWWARVAGILAHLNKNSGKLEKDDEQQMNYLNSLVKEDITKKQKENRDKNIAADLIELLQGIQPIYVNNIFPLYSVNCNRKTSGALYDSVPAVKADATKRVFNVSGGGIRWAVVDSGIDAEHMAFRKRDKQGNPRSTPFGTKSQIRNQTRIVATYNFIHIRELLGTQPDEVHKLDRKKFPILKSKGMRDKLKTFLVNYHSRVIDWPELEPFLAIPHVPKQYDRPRHRHGTHVAGIIGANWQKTDTPSPPSWNNQDLLGMCPEIELYDLRVLNEHGEGNEFAIMSALQFVRDLNNRKDFVAIHGVNLSFSIEHDVANYACGRTPVCEEAERLVGNGMVVVAAAGNSGRARYLTPTGAPDDGFRTVSITDPGNAQSLITVGATHRSNAHTYGVSYFSSRGPTGDGRLKPDLVAPGEKIRSTIPGNADERLDGTSMAAPHVSGAAALILARHPEFIGQPHRIKEILCNTATDLGRERYFQGAGLLDVLRALQSI